MNARLRAQVRDRAGGRCEYCRIHEDDDPFFTFPIDHVIAQQHGGATTLDNLWLSCFRCNAHKGPNLASVDPATAMTAQLFHPRRDSWDEHFQCQPRIAKIEVAAADVSLDQLVRAAAGGRIECTSKPHATAKNFILRCIAARHMVAR